MGASSASYAATTSPREHGPPINTITTGAPEGSQYLHNRTGPHKTQPAARTCKRTCRPAPTTHHHVVTTHPPPTAENPTTAADHPSPAEELRSRSPGPPRPFDRWTSRHAPGTLRGRPEHALRRPSGAGSPQRRLKRARAVRASAGEMCHGRRVAASSSARGCVFRSHARSIRGLMPNSAASSSQLSG
jgi:hypothetical protein